MKTICKRLFSLFVMIFLCHQVLAKRDYRMEILDFKVKTLRSEFFKNGLYSSFNKQQVTLEFSPAQNISEWTAKFGVDMLSEGKQPTNILKLEANVCNCLKATCRNNFVAPIFKELFRSSNFPKRCLLLANTKYYVRNYTLRPDDYPPFVPIITWQVTIDMSFNRKPAMVWLLKGRSFKI